MSSQGTIKLCAEHLHVFIELGFRHPEAILNTILLSHTCKITKQQESPMLRLQLRWRRHKWLRWRRHRGDYTGILHAAVLCHAVQLRTNPMHGL